MSESPIERSLAQQLDDELLSPQAQAAASLVDYNHQPPGPVPELPEPVTGDED